MFRQRNLIGRAEPVSTGNSPEELADSDTQNDTIMRVTLVTGN